MYNKIIILVAFIVVYGTACKKSAGDTSPPSPPPPSPSADTATVKGAAAYPTGVAISYDLMKNNSTYSTLVKTQFDRVTFEYQMKYQPNVQNNGSFNFTNTDELVNLVQAAGLDIFGHTLVWHQNNNTTYLRSLTSSAGPNLLVNGGFENDFTNWFAQVSSTAPTAGAISIVNSGAQNGTKAARILVTTPGPNAYSIQLVSDNFNLTSGTAYTLRYWAKATGAGQSVRAVAQGATYYQQLDQAIGTTWTEYSFPFTPTEAAVSIKFHFPVAGDYLVDNLTVSETGTVLDPVLVNDAMQGWISAIAGRYAGKVKGWDVVNEAFEDDGNLRGGISNANSFYWYSVLGRSYIGNAFKYASQADPNAVLFINDYNLEHSPVKADSLVKMVNELKAQGIPIHGIGTQMHININTSNASIDNMFIKLAATGLKIHVAELDIRVNPSDAPAFTLTNALLDQQAQKYRYVAESYNRNVPVAQRFGITVWNLTDADSWITTSLGKQDFPTLWDRTYIKKPAHAQFVAGLKL